VRVDADGETADDGSVTGIAWVKAAERGIRELSIYSRICAEHQRWRPKAQHPVLRASSSSIVPSVEGCALSRHSTPR
jgi:hypothetical protein